MGYLWFEEMELIANVEKEKGPAPADQSNAEPNQQHNHAVFISRLA